MEEAKFNNLCSHYKDSFDIHRSSIKQRDTLFYGLLVILAIFTLQISSAESVTNIVSEYVKNISGVKIGNNVEFISTLMWLMLLGFSTRYFQVVLEIERQYDYLHALEEQLNSFYPNTKAFTREGKSYLGKYPLFSKWVWLLYTLFFPVLILLSVLSKIVSKMGPITFELFPTVNFNELINLACCIIILFSTIFYIYRLHEEFIEKFLWWK